jgi:hypothetical protein
LDSTIQISKVSGRGHASRDANKALKKPKLAKKMNDEFVSFI